MIRVQKKDSLKDPSSLTSNRDPHLKIEPQLIPKISKPKTKMTTKEKEDAVK